MGLGVRRKLDSLLSHERLCRIKSLALPLRGVTRSKRAQPLVVSLTSVPKRLHLADIAIDSMLRQKLKPDHVVLWLSNELEGSVPASLLRLQRRGLTISFCDDLGPHTKLIHGLKAFPDACIVTADDDIMYPRDWLQRLYEAHRSDPSVIQCIRPKLMTRLPSNEFARLADWPVLYSTPQALQTAFPEGIYGVLYPPHSLHSEVFNHEAFQQLCPKQDDIWFKAMALMKGTPCNAVPPPRKGRYQEITGSQVVNLWSENIDNAANEKHLKLVFEHYKLMEHFDNIPDCPLSKTS